MATRLRLHPDFDIGEAIAPNLLPSRRADGWTAERQRNFCDALAAGASVENAARAQGLSPASAYSFRTSAKGAAFGIGWLAASMLQRQRLADAVTARAFEGQTITVTRPDGSTSERHYYDNRLAMSVLARLDRLAAGQVAAGVPDTSGEGQAARIAAAEFDRYLDVLSEGGGPARAGLFLAARAADPRKPSAPELAALSTLARADLYGRTGAGVASEIAVADLDLAARAEWTAAQWARAEAAGLLVVAPAPAPAPKDIGRSQESQHSPEPDEDEPVWFDDGANGWRTRFPPPDEFDGEEEGLYGATEGDYARSLTREEAEALGVPPDEEDWERQEREIAERDAWFADAAARRAAEEDEEDTEAVDATSSDEDRFASSPPAVASLGIACAIPSRPRLTPRCA